MDNKNLITEDWGIISYSEAWDKQTLIFDKMVEIHEWNKSGKLPKPYHNTIIFCSHPHVYTLGKHGKQSNMLLNADRLKAIGAEMFHIDRGGDITYHGPGQLVCYPIINLEDFNLGLKSYLHLLEESVIRLCASYGIEATRVEGATGVWLGVGTPKERKICAMGVKSSHFITMHGLALNVNTDLRYFDYINPCGFVDKGVTSLEKELGHEVDFVEVTDKLGQILIELLQESGKK